MFRSKIGALVFMGVLLLSVFRLVGTEDSAGELLTATDRLEAQRNLAGQNSPSQSPQDWSNMPAEQSDWGDGGFGQEK